MGRLLDVVKSFLGGGSSAMRTHGGGVLQVFSLFVPSPIKMDRVPEAIRDAVAAELPGGNLKWYAAAPAPGGTFTAVDYQSEDPPGRFLRLTLWREGGGDDEPLSRVAEVTLPVRFDHPFGCSGQGAGVATGEETGRPLEAGGWAWDGRVVTIAGTTVSGEEVRTKPVNGCWLLVAGGAGPSGWRQLRALDDRGKVMHGKEF